MATDTAREFDVVIFGATGFTGRKVVAEFLDAAPPEVARRTAIAGRSKEGLEEIVEALEASKTLKIIADVNVRDEASVKKMAARTRLVLNCVGPYRFYGEPVVKACAEGGTDYLDICGEPEFIERMALQYGDTARANGCYIASAAGFDSLPADMGTILTQRLFKPPAVPCSVEAVISILPGHPGYKGHYATWESAGHGFASVGQLRKLRAQAKAAGKAPAAKTIGPKPAAPGGLSYDTRVQAYTLPFPGADAAVVRRTQAALSAAGEPAVHFTARFALASRLSALLTVVLGAVMSLLAKSAWGRGLLLRFPLLFTAGLFTHEGPSEQQMVHTTTQVTLIGKGFSSPPADTPTTTTSSSSSSARPDKQVVVTLRLPDPGYYGTAILFVHAALALLGERQALPGPGVHTPGFLLRDTTYLERIQSAGVRVDVDWQ